MTRSALPIALLAGLAIAACDEPPPPDTDAGPAQDASPEADGAAPLCERDSDCSDGLFCNGPERCAPGAPGTDSSGCMGADSPCATGQACTETDRCQTVCADGSDADGDGFDAVECGGSDCDDSDDTVFGGAPEICDGVDNDCDPTTLGDLDADGDGFLSAQCCNPGASGLRCGDDCDDSRGDVHPGVSDTCGGGDEDCDGAFDEDPTGTVYFDADGDGFGVSEGSIASCSAPMGYALMDGDCDDTRAAVHPGAAESCNGRDDDCNEMIDDAELGCTCEDGQRQVCGDTEEGDCEMGVQTCVGGRWGACDGEIRPQTEHCGGGDEDCDGSVDEESSVGGRLFFRDQDGDGWGTFGEVRLACTAPEGFAAQVGDCADERSFIFPGAPGRATPNCSGRAGPPTGDIPTQSICGADEQPCWRCRPPFLGYARPATEEDWEYDCDSAASPEATATCGALCGSPA